MKNLTFHGACGKGWTQRGNATSHCGGCHETFSSLDAFDRHQSIEQGKVVCSMPDDFIGTEDPGGLVVVWSRPQTAAAVRGLEALKATREDPTTRYSQALAAHAHTFVVDRFGAEYCTGCGAGDFPA